MKWPIPEGWRELGDDEVVKDTDKLIAEHNGDHLAPGICAGRTALDCNSFRGRKASHAAFIRKVDGPVPEKEWLNA